jgi:uncharacterized membrane protein YedE/YeeE
MPSTRLRITQAVDSMNWEMLAPVGYIFLILGPPAGAYLVFVGIRDGFMRKRILSQRNPDEYYVGWRAVVQGSILVGLGLVFVAGPIMVFICCNLPPVPWTSG